MELGEFGVQVDGKDREIEPSRVLESPERYSLLE